MELLPPPPIHILRTHTAPVTTLFVSADNERIYSGDFSGHVICTSTRTLRPIVSWKAHEDGILGVQECREDVITYASISFSWKWLMGNRQARDNKLHVWARVEEYSRIGGSAALAESRTPELKYSLDVNALNYCRFSILESRDTMLIALPNLVESSEVGLTLPLSIRASHARAHRPISGHYPHVNDSTLRLDEKQRPKDRYCRVTDVDAAHWVSLAAIPSSNTDHPKKNHTRRHHVHAPLLSRNIPSSPARIRKRKRHAPRLSPSNIRRGNRLGCDLERQSAR